jgi:hypothetical protein
MGLHVDYHWKTADDLGDEPATTAATNVTKSYMALRIRDNPGEAELTIFFGSSVEAYALASAIMTGAEAFERQETKLHADLERPWVDVPLPLDREDLDEHQGVTVDAR